MGILVNLAILAILMNLVRNVKFGGHHKFHVNLVICGNLLTSVKVVTLLNTKAGGSCESGDSGGTGDFGENYNSGETCDSG